MLDFFDEHFWLLRINMQAIRILILFFYLFSNLVNALTAGEVLTSYRESKVQAINVMIGDSITYLGSWTELLNNKEIVNRGIGGDTTDRILKRMDTILSVKPSRAFIMVGVNDVYDTKNSSIKQIFLNYKKIIDILLRNNIQVYVTSTINCNRILSKPCSSAQPKIKELNLQLKSLANQYRLVYIDLSTFLDGKNGLDSKYTLDGIHINLEAYKIWSKLLRPYIG